MTNTIIIRTEDRLEEMLQYAAKAGFQDVSIGFGDREFFCRDEYQNEVHKIRELLDVHGLTCTQTHLPYYHLTISSEITDEETERSIRRAIKASAELGAKWTAYHPRTDVTNGYNRTSSLKANREILNDYLEDAERYGVGLAVENMPLYPFTAPAWRFFGGGWEELCELCDSLDSDKIGICWDFGHAHTANLDQVAAIRDLGDRLKITHVHDNYKRGDHHQLPLLGSVEWECIQWKPIMEALNQIQYQGNLALELIYPPMPMCETFMKLAFESLDYLKSL